MNPQIVTVCIFSFHRLLNVGREGKVQSEGFHYWPDVAANVPWHVAQNKDQALALSIRALDPFQRV